MSKYTKERLELEVKNSKSYAEVLRKLGLVVAGGNHYSIKKTNRHF